MNIWTTGFWVCRAWLESTPWCNARGGKRWPRGQRGLVGWDGGMVWHGMVDTTYYLDRSMYIA